MKTVQQHSVLALENILVVNKGQRLFSDVMV